MNQEQREGRVQTLRRLRADAAKELETLGVPADAPDPAVPPPPKSWTGKRCGTCQRQWDTLRD